MIADCRRAIAAGRRFSEEARAGEAAARDALLGRGAGAGGPARADEPRRVSADRRHPPGGRAGGKFGAGHSERVSRNPFPAVLSRNHPAGGRPDETGAAIRTGVAGVTFGQVPAVDKASECPLS